MRTTIFERPLTFHYVHRKDYLAWNGPNPNNLTRARAAGSVHASLSSASAAVGSKRSSAAKGADPCKRRIERIRTTGPQFFEEFRPEEMMTTTVQ